MARPPLTGVSERLFRQQLQEVLDYIEGLVAAAALADGDKGDITVSGSGATWNIDAGAVGATELASNAVETAKINDGAVTFAKLDAAAVITSGETIASNDSDTALPTSAAVIDYANNVGRVLLATKTASASATLDFTEFNNAVYRRYEFELENVLPATDTAQFRLLTSTDGGSSYDTGATDYAFARTEKILAAAESDAGGTAGATAVGLVGNVGNAAGEQGVTGIVKIWSAGSAVRTTARWELHAFDAAAGGINLVSGTCARLADQDTDAIRFLFSSGNITSGTIRMFGII